LGLSRLHEAYISKPTTASFGAAVGFVAEFVGVTCTPHRVRSAGYTFESPSVANYTLGVI